MAEMRKITLKRDTFVNGDLVRRNETVTVPVAIARDLLGRGKAVPAGEQRRTAKKEAA